MGDTGKIVLKKHEDIFQRISFIFMDHNIFYKTSNLDLGPLNIKDSELYRLLRNRDDNRSFFLYTGIISSEEQLKWYEKYLSGPDYMFSIRLKDPTHSFIGGAGIYNIDIQKKEAEFGRIIIDRELAGGKGYGYETTLALASIARDELGLTSLCLEVLPHNIAALRTYEKAGFLRVSNPDSSLIHMRKPL